MDLIADTSFLVGLWRGQGWATSFAMSNQGKSLGIPWVVLGEFQHGATRAGHPQERVDEFLALGIPMMDPSPVIPAYATLCASIQREPWWREMGQNDLWIAACALSAGLPLVTRNHRHFGKIAGLQVLALDRTV